MMTVVPVSRIAVRPSKPVSVPSTVTAGRAACQNPFSSILGRVVRVLASNLVGSSPLEY